MRILLSGSTGHLGCYLVEELLKRGHEVLALNRRPHPLYQSTAGYREWILTDYSWNELSDLVARESPDGIAHCAALSSPAACESDPSGHDLANMTFSERLIHLAEHLDCHLCFTSSDLVFEASNPQGGGFTERDQPSCWSRYAKGKLATERLVGGLGANGLSLRVCLVYGAPKGDARGNLAWILDALSDNRQVRLFCDEWRTPIYVSSLAHIIAISLETRASGLLHCGGTERVSRFEMGQALCQVMDFPEQLLLSVPQPVDGVPRRPSDVCLNSEQLYRSLGYIPMTLYDAYKQMRSELGG